MGDDKALGSVRLTSQLLHWPDSLCLATQRYLTYVPSPPFSMIEMGQEGEDSMSAGKYARLAGSGSAFRSHLAGPSLQMDNAAILIPAGAD